MSVDWTVIIDGITNYSASEEIAETNIFQIQDLKHGIQILFDLIWSHVISCIDFPARDIRPYNNEIWTHQYNEIISHGCIYCTRQK